MTNKIINMYLLPEGSKFERCQSPEIITFRLSADDTARLHVIKAATDDFYIIVWEDAFQDFDYDFGTKEYIEEHYKIKL